MARKMKDSGIEWIGEIPEDWEIVKAKYLFKQRSTKGNRDNLILLTPSQKFGVVPQAMYEELSGLRAVKLNQQIDLSNLKTIKVGDFCISLRSFQGGFEYSNYSGVVSPAYQVFYGFKNQHNIYYKYLFKDRSFIDKMDSYTMSLRDGKNISFNDFGNSFIPHPSYEEQISIANYLDEKTRQVEDIKNTINKEIEILENYKKSLITEAVTKGLDKNVPMKDSGIKWIGEIPKHWNSIKAKIFFEIKDGTHDTPKTVEKNEALNTKPLITTKNIYKNTIDLDSANHISYEDFILIYKRSNVEKYDLIMPMIGTIGSPVIVETDRKFAIKNVALLKMNGDKYISKYVYYQFHSSYIEQQMKLNSKGGVQLFISMEIISRLNMFITNREEIIKIVNYLDEKTKLIDDSIAIKEKQLQNLEDYKKSLIYEYVTGKKEV